MDMMLGLSGKNFDKFIVVGDRVLIKPKSPMEKTKAGLFLPPGVEEKRKVQSGYIVKVGPGYPIPTVMDSQDSWKGKKEEIKYFPLQADIGDLAVYLQDSAFEIVFNQEKYHIVPHSAVLLLIRDEELFE
jgi:chaperonin GroES